MINNLIFFVPLEPSAEAIDVFSLLKFISILFVCILLSRVSSNFSIDVICSSPYIDFKYRQRTKTTKNYSHYLYYWAHPIMCMEFNKSPILYIIEQKVLE